MKECRSYIRILVVCVASFGRFFIVISSLFSDILNWKMTIYDVVVCRLGNSLHFLHEQKIQHLPFRLFELLTSFSHIRNLVLSSEASRVFLTSNSLLKNVVLTRLRPNTSDGERVFECASRLYSVHNQRLWHRDEILSCRFAVLEVTWI